MDWQALDNLAKECPDLLIELLTTEFLPPPQLAAGLESLRYKGNLGNSLQDKTKLKTKLKPLLEHFSPVVRRTVRKLLEMDEEITPTPIPDETA